MLANLRIKFGSIGIGGVIIILCVLVHSSCGAVDCSIHLRCDDCLVADPSCLWCDDLEVLREISRDPNNTASARLCGDQQRMVALGCRSTVDPDSTVTQTASPGQSVSISMATVRLRPGKPATVNIVVSPPQSAAVDMYLLMDFTQTMNRYFEALQDIARDLVTRMRTITTEFRIGFGTFIDKQVPPFGDPTIISNPCQADNKICAPAYSFRNEVPLTSNVTAFGSVLNSTVLSGGLDPAEGILDALLQTAICEDIIGWRPQGQSQRIVVAITDDDYHYALDARIAGIAKLPSTTCGIDPVTNRYESASTVEYPSAAFISRLLNENQITPIFGISSGYRDLYYNLVNVIGSATVANLEPNPSLLLDQIVGEFQSISGTVIPTVIVPDGVRDILSISISPENNCAPGSVHQNSSISCVGIEFPNSASFAVTIEGTRELCGMNPVSIEIQYIRFGSVNVTVIPACSCDCTANAVESSAECSSSGTLECSTCMCDDLSQGAACQCPIERGQVALGCTPPDGGEICSGRGECNCGRCECNLMNGERFHGPFCQFDPSNCPVGRNAMNEDEPCSGNGECINVQCQCSSMFSGRTCDCTNDNSTCIDPNGNPNDLCTNEGQCVCGSCLCDNYVENRGEYCEQCVPCSASCSRVSPCVLCMLMDGLDCPANLTCKERVTINNTLPSSTRGMKVCSIREGSCEVRYLLGRRIRGDESSIAVFVDNTQSSIEVLQRGSNQCQPTVVIWAIFVGIIVGTIILGIVIIVLWRLCTYLGEYLEYEQWKKSIKDDTENTGVNPLFVGAESQYNNPRYQGRRQ